MKTRLSATSVGCALVGAAALSPALRASGLFLYEVATPDVGLASAGYAARAEDASTLFKNPAGMSRLEGTQVQAGLQLTYGQVEFSKDPGTGPFLGDNEGGNAIGALPAAGFFLTHAVSDRVSLGLGSFSYFGLAEEFDPDWVGRYYVQKGVLLGMSLMPAVSVKATDWLSLGAGLNAMYGYMDTEVAVRTGAPGDGQLKVKDETWGFGANVGVLVEPRSGTRFGIGYLSPVHLNFEDRPRFSNLGPLTSAIFENPPQLDLGLEVPQTVMFSAYHELSPRWAILANVGWQNWRQFGRVDVGVDSESPDSLTKDLNYQDTWHGAVGARWRLSEDWVVSGGFAYDSSPVNDEDRTLSLPVGEAYRIGLGVEWRVSQAVRLGAAYEFMWAGDLLVTQESDYRGRVTGGFDDSWFSFLSLSLTWRL